MPKRPQLELLSKTVNFAIEQLSFSYTDFNTDRNHYHTHYEILYVFEGTKDYSVNNLHTHTLDDSFIAMIPPNVFHTSVGNHTNSHKRYLINFSRAYIDALSDAFSYDLSSCFDVHFIKLTPAYKGIIKFMIQSLDELDKNDPSFEAKTKIISSHLLLHLSELANAQRTAADNADNPLKVTKDYIHDNYYHDLTLEQLASIAHCSKPTLTALFSKTYGITPHKYILQVRINNAKRILSNAEVRIIECATMCGFDNVTTFNRAFKSVVGISPKQFQMECKCNDMLHQI